MIEFTTDDDLDTLRRRVSFGMFLAPFHPPVSSVARALAQDLDMTVFMDEQGFSEIWFGEHYTSGYEISSDPALMIAAAAERTKHLRLGTGVASLAYHHPLMIASRIAQLDHMTRGRVLFGVGPGSLPSDAKMLGIDYTENRRRMEESVDAIMHLFTSEEPLTVDRGWFRMTDALLNYKPFSKPHPPMAVAAVTSPNAARIAGKWGLPMLSLTANNPENMAIMREQFGILRARAEEFGHPMSPRSAWRVTGPMHIAETREQAEREVEYGLEQWLHYFFRFGKEYERVKAAVENNPGYTVVQAIRDSGFGVIGTPDDAIAHIERLQEATGGFGTFLLLGHNWADRAATFRSLELIGKYVIPHFQDDLARRQERWSTIMSGITETAQMMAAGMNEVVQRHNREYAGSSTLAADHLPGNA